MTVSLRVVQWLCHCGLCNDCVIEGCAVTVSLRVVQ